MLYVCVRGVMDVVFSVCDTWSCRYSCTGSMSVSSFRCCICVSCVHPVTVLQFVNSGRGCKRRPYGRGILQSRSHNGIIGSHEYLLMFTPPCCWLVCLY